MKLFRKIGYAGPAALLVLLFAASAFAQFEVNPDHFDNSQATTKKKPVQKARAARPDASKQSAEGKSLTNAGTVAANNASNQVSQSTGQSAAASTPTKASGAAELQGQGKMKTSPSAQKLSAKAAPVPRE